MRYPFAPGLRPLDPLTAIAARKLVGTSDRAQQDQRVLVYGIMMTRRAIADLSSRQIRELRPYLFPRFTVLHAPLTERLLNTFLTNLMVTRTFEEVDIANC